MTDLGGPRYVPLQALHHHRAAEHHVVLELDILELLQHEPVIVVRRVGRVGRIIALVFIAEAVGVTELVDHGRRDVVGVVEVLHTDTQQQRRASRPLRTIERVGDDPDGHRHELRVLQRDPGDRELSAASQLVIDQERDAVVVLERESELRKHALEPADERLARVVHLQRGKGPVRADAPDVDRDRARRLVAGPVAHGERCSDPGLADEWCIHITDARAVHQPERAESSGVVERVRIGRDVVGLDRNDRVVGRVERQGRTERDPAGSCRANVDPDHLEPVADPSKRSVGLGEDPLADLGGVLFEAILLDVALGDEEEASVRSGGPARSPDLDVPVLDPARDRRDVDTALLALGSPAERLYPHHRVARAHGGDAPGVRIDARDVVVLASELEVGMLRDVPLLAVVELGEHGQHEVVASDEHVDVAVREEQPHDIAVRGDPQDRAHALGLRDREEAIERDADLSRAHRDPGGTRRSRVGREHERRLRSCRGRRRARQEQLSTRHGGEVRPGRGRIEQRPVDADREVELSVRKRGDEVDVPRRKDLDHAILLRRESARTTTTASR